MKDKKNQLLFRVFIMIACFFFLFFFLKLILSDYNLSFDDHRVADFGKGWKIISGVTDSSSYTTDQTINLPTNLSVEPGTELCIRNHMPNNVKKYNCLIMRASQQDINVYIGGVIREAYTDSKYRLFGKNSTSATLLIPVYDKDASLPIEIHIKSNSKDYSGTLNSIYLATEKGALFKIIHEYYINSIFASIILLFGIIFAVAYFVLKKSIKQQTGFQYLAWFSIWIGTWMICESRMRQFYFHNIIAAETMTYICIMMVPIPIIFHMNYVQKNRYKNRYHILIGIILLHTIISTVLQFLNIMDYYETLFISHILIGISIVIIIDSLLIDVRTGHKEDVKYSALGFIGIAISSTIEIIHLYINHAVAFGQFVGIGVLFFILMLSVSLIKDLTSLYRQKKDAVHESHAKSRFLAVMSHEIRTPISAILGMNDLILKNSTEQSITEYANNINKAGRTLLSLINDLLDFSKIEAGKMEIVPVEYDLRILLEDLIQMIENKIEDKKLSFLLDIDPTLPTKYKGDEVRIKQILTNLLTNAVKYTESGIVTLSVHAVAGEIGSLELLFSVKDTGIGIKESDINKLTDSFQRLDIKRNNNVEGTGLGLSIVQRLLYQMNSELSVQSSYGEGSEFSFSLVQPICDYAPIGTIKMSICGIRDRNELNFTAPKVKILVVDDNQMNLVIFAGLLKDTKMRIDTAMSGKVALQKVCQEKYHLIFMDHMMPDMDGIETLQEMKKLPDNLSKYAKMIVVTANAVTGSKEHYISLGFDDYIVKPVEPYELKKILFTYLPHSFVDMDQTSLIEDDKQHMVPDTDNLDGHIGLSYSGDSVETYLAVLRSYYRNGRKNRIDFQGDFLSYEISVHALKSTSLSIGAGHLSELAKEMESAAKRQDESFIQLHQEELHTLSQCVLNDIEQFLYFQEEEIDFVDQTMNQEGSNNTLKEDLLKARDALEEFDYDVAMDLIDKVLHSQM